VWTLAQNVASKNVLGVGFLGFAFICVYFYAFLDFYNINEFIWGMFEPRIPLKYANLS